jgi:protoporphyrinogen oxidase
MSNQQYSIAIVGGGCGACASAYWIHSQLPSNSHHITLFEQTSLVGGRLRHCYIEQDDLTIELGGNIYHQDVNPNLVELKNNVEHDLKEKKMLDKLKYIEVYNPYGDTQSTGVYNGKTFDIVTGSNTYLTSFKQWLDKQFSWTLGVSSVVGWVNYAYKKIAVPLALVNRYGISTLSSVSKYRKSGVKVINHMFLEKGLKEFSTLVNRYFPETLFKSCRLVMQREVYVSEKFVTEFLESVTRNIYSQNLDDYHQQAMVTTLMAADDSGLRTFVNGNSNFFRTAVDVMGQDDASLLLNTTVEKIERRNDGKFTITTVKNGTDDRQESTQIFDCVVICTPLEVANIELVNIQIQPDMIQDRTFIGCHIAIVRGVVNPKFFGMKHERDVPQLIRTTELAETKNDFTTFISFQNLWINSKGEKIYKIQSREKLTREELDQMFTSRNYLHQTYFPIAYPRLKVMQRDEKLYTELCPGLYYNNSVETVSSAMEASCWAARNVAELVTDHFKSQ